jgi:hypothetical protein
MGAEVRGGGVALKVSLVPKVGVEKIERDY